MEAAAKIYKPELTRAESLSMDQLELTAIQANIRRYGWQALMVRLTAVREKTGARILPAIYSDGYIALMPGESRQISTELRDADTRGEKPRIVVEGFNVASNAVK